MYEYYGLINKFNGMDYFVDSVYGDDTWPGTKVRPFKTINKAMPLIRDGRGDKIWAFSSGFATPFIENVVMDKYPMALIGNFVLTAASGVPLTIGQTGFTTVGNMVMGGAFFGENSEKLVRVLNGIENMLVDCSAGGIEALGVGSQIAFDLDVEESLAEKYLCGGNKFLGCRAVGGNRANTTGFSLNDHGSHPNLLFDCMISKNETGVYIPNSTTDFWHAIVSCLFSDNNYHCDENDALHHWELFQNYYDDLTANTDGWSKWRPWPYPGVATWSFTGRDPWPIAKVGGLLSNKMHSLESITAIMNTAFQRHSGNAGKFTPP